MLASGEQTDATAMIQPPEDSAATAEVSGLKDDSAGSGAAGTAASSDHAEDEADQASDVSPADSNRDQTRTHDPTEL